MDADGFVEDVEVSDVLEGGRRIPIVKTRRARDAAGPAVLLLHGLGASKEVQQKEASSLARAGLVAVTVDAPHHGARRTALLDEMHAATGSAAHAILLQMVREAIEEVPILVDRLLREGLGPVGIAGISMGAFVALGAAAAEPRIEAVVSILGSPDWRPIHGNVEEWSRPWLAEAPMHHPARFPPRAVLLANAGRDENVPPAPARAFAAALQPYYAERPDRLRYVEYPESGHFMREGDWNDLWYTTVGWLRAHLGPR